MRYTSSSIDRVREADIVKTISDYTELQRSGSDYKCKSPFSEEKTPSFIVSPSKQIFKCFSTNKGGDGIEFVQLIENCEFIDAVEKIAKIHGIFLEKEELPVEAQRKLDQKEEMLKLLNTVSRKYVATYRKLPEDHWGKKMIEGREFNEDSLVSFQIGFNEDSNKLTKWVIENGNLSVAKELGLSKTATSASYDVFKNRIIFPIHNEKGRVVGFGGRRPNGEQFEKYAKYLNSKESLVFDKSKILYGLFQAKSKILKSGTAILTEGYTDVISMHQNGCDNSIASSGTALTDTQANLIKKYASEIILLRDGDAAGIKATQRDIDICLLAGLSVSVCMLPELEDPDTFSRKQKDKTADWIQTHKTDAILWKASGIDFKRDRYDEEIQEIKNHLKQEIELQLEEKIDTESLEGTELKEAKSVNKAVLEEVEKLKKNADKEIKDLPAIDPYKKSMAVSEMATTLFQIKNKIHQKEYIKQVAKILKVTANDLKNQISNLEVAETDRKEREQKSGKPSLRGINLPEGADKDEYLEGHGFVTVGNTYYFQRITNNSFFKGTTFKMEPLFHILGDKENKRLCELTNELGQKRLISFDSDMLASFNDFRKFLFRLEGKFMFMTHNGVRTEHFDKFIFRFEEQFESALELLTMGWNKKGFYAFANGVFWQGKFRGVNKYGIMHLEGIDQNESEHSQKVDYYYSPAFSVMNIDNQEGDDLYENDRFFIYKESQIQLKEWIDQMTIVFKEKGILGTLFTFGSCFRDLFLSNYDSFPLLGGFGEKDSGKSAFGKIIQNFFYFKLPALDLTQATHVGFSRRLSRNTNTVQFCDEYQDKNVREDVFNGLMGAWNGIGREKGKGVGTNRTSYDKINSAIYYAGQFMPTRMENALATRTISMFFQNKNYSPEEKTNFNKLLNWTNSGISSLVVEVVQHRDYFEKMLPKVHAESERKLKEILKDEQYQERIFGNTSMLLTTYSILKDKIELPFTENQVEHLCAQLIIENSEQIADSNGLTEFWSIITFLFENKRISDMKDFVIDRNPSFKVMGEKRSETVFTNSERSQILYLRLKSVYQFYNKEASTREGVDVIGQTTIRNYFKSRPYFIGLIKGKRFGVAGTQSCYAFNYTMMHDKGLVTLERDESAPFPIPTPEPVIADGEPEDLPF